MYVEQPRLNRDCLQLDTLTTDEMYWVQHFAISQSFYLKSCGLKYGTFIMSWAEKSGWGWVNTFVESLDLLWGVGKLGVWQCPGQSSGLPAWRLNISKHDRICLFDSCMLLLCIPRAVRTLTKLSDMLCIPKKTHQRDVTIGELKGRLQFQCTSYIFQRRGTRYNQRKINLHAGERAHHSTLSVPYLKVKIFG